MRKVYLLLLSMMFSGLLKAQFYRTPSGKRYHTADCRSLKNTSQEITADQAIAAGLTPCLVCRPADIYASGASQKKPTSGTGETAQCKGLTKAGTRCKHMTRMGNGYCFQHQP